MGSDASGADRLSGWSLGRLCSCGILCPCRRTGAVFHARCACNERHIARGAERSGGYAGRAICGAARHHAGKPASRGASSASGCYNNSEANCRSQG